VLCAWSSFFLGNEDEAKDLLAAALLKFPTILKPLLEKIAVNPSSCTLTTLEVSACHDLAMLTLRLFCCNSFVAADLVQPRVRQRA
jgi:hypothetical protein